MSDTKQATNDAQKALVKLVGLSTKEDLAFLLANLVGLSTEIVRRKGHDPAKEIKCESPCRRTVTISEVTE